MTSTTLDLVFDGQCGFCTRAAGWLARIDRRHRIQLHPFQRAGVHERFGLTPEETKAAAWAVTPTVRASGAGSINLALDTALGTRVFSAIYRVAPARWLQDRAYSWMANHRYLLPGATPWCSAHPEDCELAVDGATCSI